MRRSVAAQFVRCDLPRLTLMTSQQTPEKTLLHCLHIAWFENKLRSLRHPDLKPTSSGTLAHNFDKDFVCAKGTTVASLLALQSTGAHRCELHAPQTRRFITDVTPG